MLLAWAIFVSIVLIRNVSAQNGQFTTQEEKRIENFSYLNLKYTAKGMLKLLAGDPEKGEVGAFGGIMSLVGGMYLYQPASGVGYVADIGRNLGLVKPALAQTCPDGDCEGFVALSPVQDLWVISRNLVYIAFIVIFVIIGFMIVLRARIDPRTTASVQAAIPGIIVSLILVTFSFAIAGLIIDLMRLTTGLIAQIFTQAGFTNQLQGLIVTIQKGDEDQNIFQLVISLFEASKDSLDKIINGIIGALNQPLLEIFNAITDFTGIKGIIVGLLVFILIIMVAFRVFIMLLTAFVTIILMTIIAPFMFLFAAIPGRGATIAGWFRSMFSAALTFPVTFLLLALAALFMGATDGPWNIFPTNPIGTVEFVPVPLGKIGIDMNDLIGIGILLFTPRVNELLSAAFQQRFQLGAAPVGELAGAAGALRRFLPF